MPTRLPERPRVRAIPIEDYQAKKIEGDRFRRGGPHQSQDVDPIDWLALWALSLAMSALLIAGLAYFSDHDARGAASVLAGTAIIIAVALRVSKPPSASD